MNFYSLYKTIKRKLEKDNKGLEILENKINSNLNLSFQFDLYNTVYNLKESNDKLKGIETIESLCRETKFSYRLLEDINTDLAKYFNINVEEVVTSDIDKAIGEMLKVNINKAREVLSESTGYRKKLLKFLNENEMSSKKLTKEQILESVADDIQEAYNSLSPSELNLVSIVRSNKQARLESKIKVISRLASSIKSEKAKAMVSECIDKLNEDVRKQDLKETAYKTFDLLEIVEGILEGEYGGAAVAKFPDMTYLKDIKMSAFEDAEMPPTIFVTFEVNFYPIGDSYSTLQSELTNIKAKFDGIRRNIVNQTIFWKNRQGVNFTGEVIWNASMRTEGAKAGKPVRAYGELALATVQDPKNPKSFDDFKQPVEEILIDLDPLIGKWFEKETDPQRQKDVLAMGSTNSKNPKGPKTKEEPKVVSPDELAYKYAAKTAAGK